MVLCEKPLARTAAEGKPMVDAVEKAGVANMVWYNYRRVPAVTLIKQMVDDGKLGQDLPLPRQVPAGLDDLARRAAGRRRHLAARRRGRRLRRHRRPARPLPRHRDLDQRRHHLADRDDRDLRQGAHARRHRQGAAGRHRRRRGGARPASPTARSAPSNRPATPAATRRATRSRSTASRARSPGTCTTSTASQWFDHRVEGALRGWTNDPRHRRRPSLPRQVVGARPDHRLRAHLRAHRWPISSTA